MELSKEKGGGGKGGKGVGREGARLGNDIADQFTQICMRGYIYM